MKFARRSLVFEIFLIVCGFVILTTIYKAPEFSQVHLLKKRSNFSAKEFKHRVYTAISQNHHANLMKVLIPATKKNFPDTVIVLYDLGLSAAQIKTFQNWPNNTIPKLIYRKFPFEKFPPSMKALKQYRFKAVITKFAYDELGDHQGFFWADSAVKWKPNTVGRLNNLTALIESTDVSPVWLLTKAGCDVASVTHPAIFTALNVTAESMANKTMGQAGLMYFHNTEKTRKIVEEHSACGVAEHCMQPVGAKLSCDFSRGCKNGAKLNCHRYDQSSINTILAKYNNYDTRNYIFPSEFSEIQR